MFIQPSPPSRCATALEVVVAWSRRADEPCVTWQQRRSPRRGTPPTPRDARPGSAIQPKVTSSDVDPGLRRLQPPPGKVVGMGHYCQLRVMAMSPGIPSGQSTIWTRSL
jgi:hypothetical protein